MQSLIWAWLGLAGLDCAGLGWTGIVPMSGKGLILENFVFLIIILAMLVLCALIKYVRYISYF